MMSIRPTTLGRCLLLAVAGVGVVLVLISTVWGVGATPDSATYLSAARNLQTGRGLTVQSDIHQSQQYYSTGRFGVDAAGLAGAPAGVIARPLTQYPPLFSILLALPGLLGVAPLSMARWLNVLLFAANILLVGGMIARYGRGMRGPALCAALVLLSSPDILTLHTMAWSEPGFIFLAFAGIMCLTLYFDHTQHHYLLGAATALALASLTRYVGAVLIVSAAAAILCLSRNPVRNRLVVAALFGCGAGLPLGLWFLRNAVLAGSLANRESVFHPVPRQALAQAATTIGAWFLPVTVAHPLQLAGGLIVLASGCLAASLLALARDTQEPPAARALWRLSVLLILLIVLYWLFLLFTVSFYDAATPLDGRILSPVFVAVLLLVVTHLQWHLQRRATAWPVRLLLLTWAGLVVGLNFATAIPQIREHYNVGINYTGRDWRQSDTIRRLQGVAPAALIYSNGPDAIYIVTGRGVNLLPPKANIYTQRANPYYQAQVALLREQARQRPVFVVYFHTVYRPYLPPEDELQRELALTPVYQGTDGVIYQIGAAGRGGTGSPTWASNRHERAPRAGVPAGGQREHPRRNRGVHVGLVQEVDKREQSTATGGAGNVGSHQKKSPCGRGQDRV